ncbi:GNAT family N-acetyltransferase [Nonomuraea longispora]|uniref:GNAT family N-acetyltransferase n=1 Tax=Nonomuraea longispora TaxID=1848320 RepID=UPI00140501BC|nr:GNAT family N-acetyltransferase [Nonomuraea longispora]
MAAFEGRKPIVPSTVAVTPDVLSLPFSPFEPLQRRYNAADRLTFHIPLNDAVGATLLGRLGFSPESYLAFNQEGSSTSYRVDSFCTIRDATFADIASVSSLHYQHVKDQLATSQFISEPKGAPDILGTTFAQLIENGQGLLVAEHKGTLVGAIQYGSFMMPDDGKVRRLPPGYAGVIEWICVAPESRNAGLGSALVSEAICRLRILGTNYVYVCHGTNNRLSTSCFWNRFNFTPHWVTLEYGLI